MRKITWKKKNQKYNALLSIIILTELYGNIIYYQCLSNIFDKIHPIILCVSYLIFSVWLSVLIETEESKIKKIIYTILVSCPIATIIGSILNFINIKKENILYIFFLTLLGISTMFIIGLLKQQFLMNLNNIVVVNLSVISIVYIFCLMFNIQLSIFILIFALITSIYIGYNVYLAQFKKKIFENIIQISSDIFLNIGNSFLKFLVLLSEN